MGRPSSRTRRRASLTGSAQEKLSQGVHVRELVPIVNNPDALRALNESGFLEAKARPGGRRPGDHVKVVQDRMREMAEELDKHASTISGVYAKARTFRPKRIVAESRKGPHPLHRTGADWRRRKYHGELCTATSRDTRVSFNAC